MDKLIIRGGYRLEGSVPISGSKNASFPLMAAALLTEGDVILGNVPSLSDMRTMRKLLRYMGVTISTDNGSHVISSRNIKRIKAPYDIVKTMRGSFIVLGPLLARFGKAKVSMPGGCALGARMVDTHIEALEQLGAKISVKNGYVIAKAPKGLTGCDLHLNKVTVGGTQTAVMASVLAKGRTVITNATIEPENVEMCRMLVSMGARIEGIGTSTLTVTGVDRLHGTTWSVIPDRIETGTYAVAAAITKGRLTLTSANPDDIASTLDILRKAGVGIEIDGTEITVDATGRTLKPVDISTEPHPGIPTDMQAQLMALMAITRGRSVIRENIFENRFMHVPELARLGASIILKDAHTAQVTGVKRLRGAHVMATDLRASVALVLAGLVADGMTEVHRIYHLDRGYERLEEKLRAVGADIVRARDEGADD